jgi:hypothetical protein
MRYIKSYKLFESLETEMNFDKIVEVLSTECSEFLDLLEEKNIKGLYRGATIHDTPIVDGFWKMKPFENRLSRDTKPHISKLLDEGFVKKFGIPLRSRGVFATKDLSIAKDYGRFKKEAFLFFPKNGFRYFWNSQIEDLYTELRDNTSFYNKEPFFWSSSEKRQFQNILYGYQEGEIEKVKWQELTFICDEYYMLDLDYYDKFLNYFIK